MLEKKPEKIPGKISLFGTFEETTQLFVEAFRSYLQLKQDDEAFYSMIRQDFQKRLCLYYFEDDRSGQLTYLLKFKHWYHIPFYFFFRDRRRILSETAIIVAEEYLFKLTGRKVKKGHTDFIHSG